MWTDVSEENIASILSVNKILAEQETRMLARLIFNFEDRGDKFLSNVGSYMDYTALYTRRWQLSYFINFSYVLYLEFAPDIVKQVKFCV
jgi:hypothetical protein